MKKKIILNLNFRYRSVRYFSIEPRRYERNKIILSGTNDETNGLTFRLTNKKVRTDRYRYDTDNTGINNKKKLKSYI